MNKWWCLNCLKWFKTKREWSQHQPCPFDEPKKLGGVMAKSKCNTCNGEGLIWSCGFLESEKHLVYCYFCGGSEAIFVQPTWQNTSDVLEEL